MDRRSLIPWLAGAAVFSGCADSADEPTAAVGVKVDAVSDVIRDGQEAFDNPLPGANGRACATCHVEAEHTALHPENVVTRLNENPTDPLFNRIDADDPNAETPTYEHLKKGLVRVTLKLPDNVDLIAIPPDVALFVPEVYAQWRAWYDNAPPQAQVVTPPDRMVSVWRAVPSVENTAYTDRFLFDGRATTLQEQAEGALRAHSQVTGEIDPFKLDAIAAYEKSLFSDKKRAGWVANQVFDLCGTDNIFECPIEVVNSIKDPELKFLKMTPQQEAGKVVYEKACRACHGTQADNRIVRRDIHDAVFFDLKQDGNLKWQITPQGPAPVLTTPGDEFINIGTNFITYASQVTKILPPSQSVATYTQALDMPRYRLRFYTDATRTQIVTDQPPLPVLIPNAGPFAAAPDENGFPIVGPALAPQLYTTDPGRALITGNPLDFEGFDTPQLRGIANTAPYFHDNSMATLADMVDAYSRFILPFVPQLGLVPNPVPGVDVLTDQEKADLVEFLKVF